MILSTNSYYMLYCIWFSQPIAIMCGTVYDSHNQYVMCGNVYDYLNQ